MSNPTKNPSLLRRFAAILYDGFLLFAVLYFAGLLSYVLTHFLGMLYSPEMPSSSLYTLYLTAVAYVYYAAQWRYSGQTLGMKTWRIQLQTIDGQRLSWWQALVRFSVSIASWVGLIGFLWALWDKEKRTWHDIASETRLVLLPKS